MSRVCTICSSPNREAIGKAIGNRTPYRSISRWYGVGIMSISRHLNNCIPKALRKVEKMGLLCRRVYCDLRK